jgi:hypothetical protein
MHNRDRLHRIIESASAWVGLFVVVAMLIGLHW